MKGDDECPQAGGQAPQNSKLADLRPEHLQRLVPPILNFAVPDPVRMLFLRSVTFLRKTSINVRSSPEPSRR